MLIKSRCNKKIIVPTYKGQQGNPVLFDISLKNEIMKIQGDKGAKKILHSNKNEILKIETNDQNISLDFNVPYNFILK